MFSRLTEKNVKFREAIVDCLTEDPAHYGPIVNLIRVGQLRKLRNVESHRFEKRDSKVRVDAFKDQVWNKVLESILPIFVHQFSLLSLSVCYILKSQKILTFCQGRSLARIHGPADRQLWKLSGFRSKFRIARTNASLQLQDELLTPRLRHGRRSPRTLLPSEMGR